MNYTSRFVRSKLSALQSLSLAILTACLVLAIPVASNAQETTSAIRGSILAPDGGPAANVSVRVTDTRTGRVSTATTSTSGRFTVGNLAVGGPYTISLTSTQYASQSITDVVVALGETFDFSLTLAAESIEEIVVTAAAVQSVQVAVGPSSTFDFDEIQNAPAFDRDIKDIVRLDPRVYINEADVDNVQCLGANPRFNSTTVDGVKMNDNFGLNRSGYPTERMPFPYDAIQNVSIELSPYDVQYGGFTACNTNAVTRSGTNEFEGSVFVSYGDADLQGDSLEGDPLPSGDFDDERYGFSIGGPIIRDTLFFFAAYEKRESANLFDRCAGDQLCGRPVLGVSQAQLDRIRDIAVNQYGWEPGPEVASLPNEDEKYLVRLDWNINDQHNAGLTHVWNDGFNVLGSDTDSDEYEFSNHYRIRGAELTSTTAQLFSDWTDTFSTELRIGFANLDNRQFSPNSQGFGEMQIETYFDGDNDGDLDRAIVYLGGDDSRQANDLEYDTFNFKLAANWVVGDHILSAGLEQEEIDIFNVFVQHSVGGEYRFDENRTNFNGDPVGCSNRAPWSPSGCIDQFEAFSPDDVYYGNAPSLNPFDAAGEFKYAVNTFYLQDEFTAGDGDLTIVAGLRYDWYTSDDLPRENANFIARTGFTNAQNFDGESLLQPRLGFTWNATDTLTLRGGVGLFSGGNPNVWLSNAYSNDGFTAVQTREGDCDAGLVGDCIEDMNLDPNNGLNTIPLGVDGNGRPGFDAPQAMIDFVQNTVGNASVNGIDPGFKVPSAWKYSLGATWVFGDGYVVDTDVIFTRARNSAIYRDDALVQYDTAPDGRPIYTRVDKDADPVCATDPTSNWATCSADRLFNQDFILDNVDGPDAEGFAFSATLQKDHDFGLSWLFGYAFVESEDINPMTSSVAFSNFFNVASSNLNNPGLATSNYEIPHRFMLNLSYEREFFADLTTRFTLFGQANQGRPYSAVFASDEMFFCGPFFCPDNDGSLLYMPTGPNDPLVQFDPAFDQEAFFAWAEEKGLSGYAGGIVPRNSLESAWWQKWDLRISQELPGFSSDHRAQLWVNIENIGNLLNDDWGVLKERSFPRRAEVVSAELSSDGTQYIFNDYFSQGVSRVTAPSLWRVRVGVTYRF
ncbi:MAG: TonB-dependent receptor [Woeseiaceae bacterium]|nr:TonB-dependent receptor [Woeseiaceae bacterium]